MPFVPHTQDDEASMLNAIGVADIETLFDEIPAELRSGRLLGVPAGISEMAMLRLMAERSAADSSGISFIGAGAYEHHIPSVVWDVASRGEFLTAYTPYQAEASQGTLQLIYEYQTMMSRLTGMEVANASVYDGASALAEAMLMGVRANKKSKSRRILCAGNIHPHYLKTCRTIVTNQQIEIDTVDWSEEYGTLSSSLWREREDQDYAALVVSYPNFFGGLDDVGKLTDWAHDQNMVLIAVVNPMALGILRAPGEWGQAGADIVVGEGQPFGIPVASGGPYLGYMCCNKAIVRQMPGRIIGRTLDQDGREGFTLTLQAREQHIRRGKATSNICTNQGLLVTAATIYLSLLGDRGLASVATECHNGMLALIDKCRVRLDIHPRFSGPVFHEVAFELPARAADVLAAMADQDVLGGYDLGEFDARLANCMLTNVTETRTEADLDRFVEALAVALKAVGC